MVENPDMGPPWHQNIMLEKKENSDAMGVGLGTNNITLSKIQKRGPPKAKPRVGHKENCNCMGVGLEMNYVTWWEI